LHEVDEKELIAGAGKALPLARQAPAAARVLGGEDLSVLFGLDIAQGIGPDAPAKAKSAKAPASKKAMAVGRRQASTASRKSIKSKKK